MEYLSEQEKAALEKFASDPVTFEAVRKALLEGIYYDGTLLAGKEAEPMKNFILGYFSNSKGGMPAPIFSMSDEDMGANLREIIHGISFIESGFKDLAKYKPVEVAEPKENKNPAR